MDVHHARVARGVAGPAGFDRRARRVRPAAARLLPVGLVVGAAVLACGQSRASSPRVPVPARASSTTVRTLSSDRYGRVQILTLRLSGPARTRTVWVYRPAVRDSASLPVAYFLHGVPGAPSDVFVKAHAVRVMTAYLAAGGRPFVLASLDGRGIRHRDTEWLDAVDGTDPIASLALGPQLAAVEGGVRRDSAHRAIIGYSMGGYGAVNLAMLHRGLFGQVVSIGGYFHVDDPARMLDDLPSAVAANTPVLHPTAARGMRLLLIDGRGDRDRSARGQTPAFARALAAARVPATTVMVPGGHTWTFVTATLPSAFTFLGGNWAPPRP